MRVAHPSNHNGDGHKDLRGEEETKVSYADGRLCREQDVSYGCYDGCADDERSTQPDAIGDEGAGDNGYPAYDVGRRAEAVGLDLREGAHFRNDGRHEEREGAETDVAAKVHEGGEVA